MAVCTWCNQEMTTGASCTVRCLHHGGVEVRMSAFRGWRGAPRSARCGDCGVKKGGFHHPGCDLQRCPRCRGQLLACGCRFDEDGPLLDAHTMVGDVSVDANGCLTEVLRIGGQEVIVHYDDVPESDITTLDGIRLTTPLRTVIDVAPEVEAEHLEEIVAHCLHRGLFTLDEARERLAQDDMRERRGAMLLRRVLGL